MPEIISTPTSNKPHVVEFFDTDTNTFSYVVTDSVTRKCAVIDSVLNFDFASGSITYDLADRMVAYIRNEKLCLDWIIETHVHADHLSAAPYIKQALGGRIGIGERISTVQDTFAAVFNEGAGFARDGSQFDYLFKDGERYALGSIECFAMHTPGHTPACMTHVIGDAAFVGDTLFMPDGGTARCDFPGGSADTLYDSIQKIFSLPDETRMFICHDYQPNGRPLQHVCTIAQAREDNIHVGVGQTKASFTQMREARDEELDMPRLILPSLQVNMRAGNMPEPENDDRVYLKIPINAFKS